MTTLKPETEAQVLDAVAWAAAEGAPLEIVSGGTKRAIGRPGNAAHTLDLRALRGIALYEPEELVLAAGPGTPLVEIETALAANRQELAFEPPDYGPLLGVDAGQATIGGILATNLAGPRRAKAGAARDHFLGFRAVTGRGEAIKSGGRVVKNVTGYDLSKLMAGSWGTLAVLTAVTVKVLPAGAKTRTVLLMGADAAVATRAMTAALQSPHDVSAAAWLPVTLAARSAVSYVADAGAAVTGIRVEGPGPSVEYRCAALREVLAPLGPTEELHGRNSKRFWAEVRDVTPFAGAGDGRAVWKISVPPQSGAALAMGLCDRLAGEAFLDWGGGLVWLAVDEGVNAGAPVVRGAVAAAGGHATLIRASADLRRTVPTFQPQAEGLARLSQRIKDGFDPNGVLNPGRMYAGG